MRYSETPQWLREKSKLKENRKKGKKLWPKKKTSSSHSDTFM